MLLKITNNTERVLKKMYEMLQKREEEQCSSQPLDIWHALQAKMRFKVFVINFNQPGWCWFKGPMTLKRFWLFIYQLDLPSEEITHVYFFKSTMR